MADAARHRLRETFDSAADRYHRARPRYPEELLAAFDRLAGLDPGSRLLEVGPATGVATEQLARRGHHVTAVELGRELAAAATMNLEGIRTVEVVNASFEEWTPPEWGRYDAVVAATSWHWVDPDTRYERAHRHLRPGGSLAFWSARHVFPDGGDPLFVELQPIYDEIGEGMGDSPSYPRPGELPTMGDEVEQTGLFDLVDVVHLDWEIRYDAESYIDLLETFSGHLAMADWQRARLYGAIRRMLAQRPDGLLRRHWGAALHVARRRDR